MFLIGPFLTVATDSPLIASYGSGATAMRCQWRVSCACLISYNCRLFPGRTRLRQNCGRTRRYFQTLSSCRRKTHCFLSDAVNIVHRTAAGCTIPSHPLTFSHDLFLLLNDELKHKFPLCPFWLSLCPLQDGFNLLNLIPPPLQRSYLQAFSTSLWTSDIEWATRCKSVALSDPCHS